MTVTHPQPTALLPGDRRRITIAVVGTLLGVCVILVMLGVLLYVGYTPPTVPGTKSDAERMAILNQRRAEDQHALSTYGWVNQDKGIVRIPIDLAMRQLIEESAATPNPTTHP